MRPLVSPWTLDRSFSAFLHRSLQQGPTNVFFEYGMYRLWQEVERLVGVFDTAAVPFALLGGVAVNAHLRAAGQDDRCFVAQDIDVVLRRPDLPAVEAAARQAGYRVGRQGRERRLLLPGQLQANAVHLLCAEERRRPGDPVLTPALVVERKALWERPLPVAPVDAVVLTMLTSGRALDWVHLEILDSAGLLTPAIEQSLPTVLEQRLQAARAHFEPDQFDGEEPASE